METDQDQYVKILFKHCAFNEDDESDCEDIESAWAIIEGDNYILQNTLFYAKMYSWGDVISAVEKDGDLYASGLIRASGYSTIRVLFYDIETRDRVIEKLQKKGCGFEGSNIEELISVSIPPNVLYYKEIASFLARGERKSDWGYEEACISSVHRRQK